MKDTIIAVLLNLSFAGCMAYGVFGGYEQLVNIGIAMAWIISVLAILVSTLMVSAANRLQKAENEKRDVLVKYLENGTRKSSTKWLGKVTGLVAIVCMALSGWIFTCIIYAIVWLTAYMCFAYAKKEPEDFKVLNGGKI
ncbi:hypothetical protein LHV16_05540 [Providencia rettgeri]|uniref:hypothetical protein n=1 Tax=Providencia rettgeri TaxID=587 RepID=UPI001B394481|nr:hypothetical protein [Providencia rettgeri]EJD6367719.1 hypothetical protein [Providencia rettgeri]EJD6371439.1 hypothetical protein [Providencia rettgeri]ELR5030198.1 hypothetical protein [Providencia rettgeri]ELR5128013.1 hypothetical protein [Providencia rettgeri]ELR5161856.1 hypothetical protein [Providencia rettgeri]